MQPLEQHPQDVNPKWGEDGEVDEKPQSFVSKNVFEMLVKKRQEYDTKRINSKDNCIR